MPLCCLSSCYLSALLHWAWDCANHISAPPAAPWPLGRLCASDRKERLASFPLDPQLVAVAVVGSLPAFFLSLHTFRTSLISSLQNYVLQPS